MLPNIRVASPCSAAWNQMRGDDRFRYCPACNLNVYNFSAMSEREITMLLAQREGRICGRLYQRRDGTILTTDCPVGFKALVRRVSRIAGIVLSAMAPTFTSAQSRPSYSAINLSDAAIDLTIIDDHGRSIRDATVSLLSTDGDEFQSTTDQKGRLRLLRRVGGRYTVTVTKAGFNASSKQVDLRNSQALSLRIRLYPEGWMGVIAID